MDDSPPPTPSSRWSLKRYWIPLAFALCVAVVYTVLYVRGTMAESAERNPSVASEGAVTQLLKTSDGRKVVRSAMVIDRPIDEVWSAVTDYPNFTRIFPYLVSAEIAKAPDGRHQMKSIAELPLAGKKGFEVLLTHAESPEARTVSWDAPSSDMPVNRGNWKLVPLGPKQTLLAYTLDVEIKGYPGPVVRSFLLWQLKRQPQAIAEWLAKNPAS